MRALSAAELMEAWETGLAQSATQRALTLLAIACADAPLEQLAQLTIGRRDAELLKLHERLFGAALAGLATCPKCGQQSEVQFTAADFQATAGAEPAEGLVAVVADYKVTFRLPNSLDLLRLTTDADAATNRGRLLEQCIHTAQRDGQAVGVEQLPRNVVTTVVERMAEADPQADSHLTLNCPQCAHQWQAQLDILSFVWSEIHSRAGRLLQEVHALASAYGWREADILALSPWRRRAYLEMVTA